MPDTGLLLVGSSGGSAWPSSTRSRVAALPLALLARFRRLGLAFDFLFSLARPVVSDRASGIARARFRGGTAVKAGRCPGRRRWRRRDCSGSLPSALG